MDDIVAVEAAAKSDVHESESPQSDVDVTFCDTASAVEVFVVSGNKFDIAHFTNECAMPLILFET